MMAQLKQRCYQNVIFFREPEAGGELRAESPSKADADAAFPVHSRKAKPVQPKPKELWHSRMGHYGAKALEHLSGQSLGVKFKGIPTYKCEFCALAKLRKTISRQTP